MTAPADHALQCDQLAVGLPGLHVLTTVHARLEAGRVTAILGPNGAGKSTLLSMLSGLRPPRAGQVRLAGRPVGEISAVHLARHRAVLAQDTAVAFDFTVQEVVEMGRYAHRRAPSHHEAHIVRDAMQATGVAHLAAQGMQTLSGGERARAQLARALAQVWEPPGGGMARWLLLDEPTAALDLSHQHHTMALVRQWARGQGVGVVAVLHDLNLALRYADDALLLRAGQHALTGPVSGVLTPDTVARVWQVQCTAVHSADGVRQLLMTAGAQPP